MKWNVEVGTVRSYWWKVVPNFGDAIAPLLLEHFTGIKTEWASVNKAHVVSVGSVLEHVPKKWVGYILGSGKLFEHSKIDIPFSTILSLRGPLSAQGILGSFALGDPGILANELVGFQDKKWDLGIVPHWRDKKLVTKFTKSVRPTGDVLVIDPGQDPIEVLKQIGSCRKIVTSSLHGLIVADAFLIPRRLEISPALSKEGGDFKFRDYSASINTPFIPGEMMTPSIRMVEELKFNVFDAYEFLASELGV
jgi:pyruvyltransferase